MPADVVEAKAYLDSSKVMVDRWLESYLPADHLEPRSLHQAIRYSVMAGGKRLRPILALATHEYCGG
ncbi:MAG: polyprenyl synthetase family protein, partial [candidate division Zixibacteria bacterium]|nr:polyprenyl synthetase family protein [candidate division Zixibacteria bacterium]